MKKYLLLTLISFGAILTASAQGTNNIFKDGTWGAPVAPNGVSIGERISFYEPSGRKTAIGMAIDNGIWLQAHGEATMKGFEVFTGAVDGSPISRFVVLGNGNTGIGINNPNAKLDLNGIFQVYPSANAGSYGALKLRFIPGASGTIIEANNDGPWMNHDLILNASNTMGGSSNQLVIHRSGYVGIGSPNPSSKFEVNGIFQVYPTANAGSYGALKLRFIPGASGTIIEANNDGPWMNHDLILNASNNIGSNSNQFVIHRSGNIGIGTASPGSFKLAVEGNIGAREVVVTSDLVWPDYVFKPSYTLMPLSQLEEFIKKEKTSPEIPSEKEIKENGHNLGEMNALLLKKIEELTLYVIELKKENQEIKSELKSRKDK